MNRFSEDFIKESINKDVFERNKKLHTLISILVNSKKQNSIVINGKWGSGKSVFVRQLEYLLNDDGKDIYSKICSVRGRTPESINGISVFYYNAWENDYFNNPLLSLMFELVNHYKIDIETGGEYREIAKLILRLVKIASLGNVDIDTSKISEDILEEIKSTKEIRDIFNKLIDNILAEKYTRLIVVVDELDRCKPSYAIAILEVIKHFYHNEKISFIYATNVDQLANTVRKEYGESFDADLYLYRFFDKRIDLSNYNIDNYLREYLEYSDTYSVVLNVVRSCISSLGLSIRQTNEYIYEIKFNSRFFDMASPSRKNDKFDLYFIFFAIGLAIKVYNIALLNGYLNGSFKFKDFIRENEAILKFELIELFGDKSDENNEDQITQAIDSLNDKYMKIFKRRENDLNMYRFAEVLDALEL